MPHPADQTVARLLAISTVGTEMVAPIVLGWVVDYFTGWMPAFMIVGAVLGLFIGIRRLVQLTKPKAS